ncbi:dTMP kinase [Methanothermobacter sp. EMTCatA1]|uniref:dTMP kinase n=1 Tax=Methanothermobacter sp. EMTCatA1 TaxID=2017966 RepID=UPI000B619F76|nr:dTMP kinase [Methanothermobacter sp. EMTCatA1]BAZ99750.1 Thymidylate kinase [Methanothermobacter sp. EMTCatA1]
MYICFEGIDGSGKTTHAALTASWLRENGYMVHEVREPTDSNIGGLIRSMLSGPDARTRDVQRMLALLFAADRLTLRSKIEGDWAEDVVVSDRCYYSSLVYQGPEEWICEINRFAPRPDIVILLDLDVEVAMERCGGTDEFEDPSYLAGVRERYLELADKNGFYTVNAERGVNLIQRDIRKILAPHFGICSGGIL